MWQVIINIIAYLYNAVTKTEVEGEGHVEEWRSAEGEESIKKHLCYVCKYLKILLWILSLKNFI